MEDNFSTDGAGAGGDGSGGNVSDGERWAAAEEALLARPPAHLLLCGPGPNRLRADTGPRPRELGTPVLNQVPITWLVPLVRYFWKSP